MEQDATADRHLPLSWLPLAWVGFLFSQLVIGTIAAIGRGDPRGIVEGWGLFSDFTQFAIVLYVVGSCLGVGLLLLLVRGRGLGWKAVGMGGSWTWRGVGLGILGAVLASQLYVGVEALMGSLGVPMFWYESEGPVMSLSTPTDVGMVLSLGVLLGPVLEEILFRGYVLRALLQRGMRVANAVLLSALIFTSVHVFYGPGVLLFIFFWSLIPSYLFLSSGNLRSAILFHCLNNGFAFVVVPLVF